MPDDGDDNVLPAAENVDADIPGQNDEDEDLELHDMNDAADDHPDDLAGDANVPAAARAPVRRARRLAQGIDIENILGERLRNLAGRGE